jgi:hypothetical protein
VPAKPVPARWASIDAAAPVMAATMLAYLGRLSDELSTASVAAAEVTLRQFAGHVIATDPTCRSVAATGAATWPPMALSSANAGRAQASDECC